MKTLRFATILLLATVFSAMSADSLDDVKDRMDRRLNEVTQLKVAKIVGENNQGYLEFVGDKQTKQKVVEAENADRKMVYEMIAVKAGISADQVGRQRAKQIADRSDSGIMIQLANGTWKEK